MTVIKAWLNTWWLRFPEPRELSMLWSIMYLFAMATGVLALCLPPRSVIGMIGDVAIALIGVFLLVGALLAALGGAFDYWRLERIGILAQGAAWGMYLITVIAMQITGDGSRFVQMGAIATAMCAISARYLLIRIYTYKPDTSRG